MNENTIGIMGAEPQEIEGIINLFEHFEIINLGMRQYYRGVIQNKQVVVVYSRSGKVAASSTVTTLINYFGVSKILFTGVAGALHEDLQVGDVVVGKRLVQHDVDVRPFRPQFELPILGISFFESDQILRQQAMQAIEQTMVNQTAQLKSLGINKPKVYLGDIASGDQFISNDEKKQELRQELPSVLCVEMEGAAVAQVCYEYQIPFIVIRSISDSADESSSLDFSQFLIEVASKYSAAIISQLLQNELV